MLLGVVCRWHSFTCSLSALSCTSTLHWYISMLFCCFRHPSNEFGYGNTSVTVKMMNQDGTFLPGEMSRELGYVSNSVGVLTCHQCWMIFLMFVYYV